MADGEAEDQNVRYWRTKYELLYADYGRTKDRTEGLESRLLELVEESDRRESEQEERIRRLDGDLEEARRRIEQLEAACFRYKNQNRVTPSASSNSLKGYQLENVEEKENKKNNNQRDAIQEDNDEELGEDVEVECLKRIARTASGDFNHLSVDGITRSPEFHGGHHVVCEYHKLPVLAKGEGFIYGFRWTLDSKIHVV